MATITGRGSVGNDKYWLYEWEGLTVGDTGTPVSRSSLADKTVSVEGTFDGTTVVIEGSQDMVQWFVLNDASGDPASFAAAGMILLAENPRFIRPSVTGGTAPDINVRIGAGASL